MVSFGHAAFIGTGAYTVGILMQQGVMSVWIAWPAAVLVSALFAPAVGAISLRTRGVYFHHDHAGLRADAVLPDGVGEGLGRRDQTRMGAIGFPVYRYQFVAFTLAGALLANQSSFVSPSLLQWNQSGLLLVMVILGGMRHLWGGFIGAVVFLLLEGITRLPMPQRVLRGLARSCQITSIFQRLSVRDNVALAVQARQGSSLRFWRPPRWSSVSGSARRCMRSRAHSRMASSGSWKSASRWPRRRSCMGPDESERMVELLQSLRGETMVLLVEHDMDAVFRLADRISVLVFGKVIACGTPDQTRADADVRRACLGDEAHEVAA